MVAYCSFTYHVEVPVTVISMLGSPIKALIRPRTVSSLRSGSPFAGSNPHPAIHLFHGSILRSKPIPISPTPAARLKIQCKMLGR